MRLRDKVSPSASSRRDGALEGRGVTSIDQWLDDMFVEVTFLFFILGVVHILTADQKVEKHSRGNFLDRFSGIF